MYYNNCCTLKSLVECYHYSFLEESNRAIMYKRGNTVFCDSTLSGWYRFRGGAGIQMPESCVKSGRCGTQAPGWLVGGHPSVAQGAVKRRVCFKLINTCCLMSINIDVRNCGGFFVYKLIKLPGCRRYCGNGAQPQPGMNQFHISKHREES